MKLKRQKLFDSLVKVFNITDRYNVSINRLNDDETEICVNFENKTFSDTSFYSKKLYELGFVQIEFGYDSVLFKIDYKDRTASERLIQNGILEY